jgi:hypothetical protein
VKTTDNENERLATLRTQYTEKQGSIVRLRAACQRISAEMGQARVAHILEPESHKPKEVEARLRRLEAELKTAGDELTNLGPECQAIASAIEKIEAEFLPKQHAQRLSEQAEVQSKYKAVCRRLVEHANALAAASEEARTLYDQARSAYPRDAFMHGQEILRASAGLQPVWDPHWVNFGNSTQRDHTIGNVWQYDRSLVDPTDLVAQQKLHQENHHKQWCAQLETERMQRMGEGCRQEPTEPAPARPLTLSERMSGEQMDAGTFSIRVRA